jgi:cystinosin
MVALGLSVFIAVYAAVVASGHGGEDAWWLFVLNISYVKLAISCCKYIPQVIINHRRRSTGGWSIHNVLLDFTGGLLSVIQQCGDAQATGDWAGM